VSAPAIDRRRGSFFFYTALNAVVRARLALDHIAEAGARSRKEWIHRAAAYLTIAAKACRQLNP